MGLGAVDRNIRSIHKEDSSAVRHDRGIGSELAKAAVAYMVGEGKTIVKGIPTDAVAKHLEEEDDPNSHFTGAFGVKADSLLLKSAQVFIDHTKRAQ